MRAVVMVALAALGGTVSLRAQHGHAYEFGVFGSYTRYDPTFTLPNRVGGGVRLGYLFNAVLQAEVEVLFPSEYTVGASGATLDPLIGSASLVFNLLPGERNILYVLAGYSRLDFGTSAPYQFTDDAAHGAIGDRIFLTHNMALRFEARGLYTPTTQSTFGTKTVTHILGTVGLSIFAANRSRRAPPPPPLPAPLPVPLVAAAPPESTAPAVPPPAAEPAPLPVASPLPAAPAESLPPRARPSPPPPVPAPPVPAPPVPVAPAPAPAPPKCANTPPGVPVDSTGCMILFRPEVTTPPRPGAVPPRPTLILRGVTFQTGRSVLTSNSYALLDEVAASLLANSEIRIEIAGYTDNTGPMGVNLRLSQARAAAVRAYLARRGVSPARMIARGYGSRSPLASNTAPAGRAQNRRVELHKLP